tara:strand:+ start:3350 stop:3607 length:258 start_codon:yes stop_codon:yes gene_type:complete
MIKVFFPDGKQLEMDDTFTHDGVEYKVEDIDKKRLFLIGVKEPNQRRKVNAENVGFYVSGEHYNREEAEALGKAKRSLREFWEDT